ncbi:hypothetical protein ACOSP7_030860 [Xanthoceras sorbifolium]
MVDSLVVRVVACHERYLCLPSFMFRNKRHLFSYIKYWVWSKIRDWQDKLFSNAGKMVLLKVIVQSIPTYYMNLFRLPRALIKELHRLCAFFWWDSVGNSKKLH